MPNIAHFIVNTEPFKSRLNLKGLALVRKYYKNAFLFGASMYDYTENIPNICQDRLGANMMGKVERKG